MCSYEIRRKSAVCVNSACRTAENLCDNDSFILPSSTTNSTSEDQWSTIDSEWWNAKVWNVVWRPGRSPTDVWLRLPWVVLLFGLAQVIYRFQ